MDYRQELTSGSVLDRKYRIENVIGFGGFGITYSAVDLGLATRVAVKEYYPAQFAMRDSTLSIRPASEHERPLFHRMRDNFLREARTLARFDHPGIVRVLNVFEAHGTAYMVMRLETGLSLKAWRIKLERAPTQVEIDRIGAGLLDAVEVMHAASFLHRDIAPDNIIVRQDGSPVVLDFGSTRRVMTEASTAMTGIVKRGYSPQEQYSSVGRGQGPWTDIYSLAATLYYAIAGTQPIDATERILEDRLPPAASFANGDYRSEFLAAIDWGMSIRPGDRPSSIADWREKLFGPTRPRQVVRPSVSGTGLSTPPRLGAAPRSAKRIFGVESRLIWGGAICGVALVSGVLMLNAANHFRAVEVTREAVSIGPSEQGAEQARKLTERLEAEAAAGRQREESEQKARAEAARLAAEAAAQRQRTEAEQRARDEAARVAAEVAAQRQRAEAEQRARDEAARVAAEAAAQRQRAEAEQKARDEAAARVAAEAAAQRQRAEAEQRAREAARVAAEAAAQRQRAEAEQKARAEAARLAAEAAAQRQRAEAEQKARDEAAHVAAAATSSQGSVPEGQYKLILNIRQELNRVGCLTNGHSTGWAEADQKALERFVRYSSGKFSFSELNGQIVEAVGSYVGRVCPIECGSGDNATIDRCVAPIQARAIRCGDINERAQAGGLSEDDREILRSGRCR